MKIKATSWKSAALSLWMGMLCNDLFAQTGLSQARFATDHEEMLIEKGYIFFPPLRTRKDSPPSEPAMPPIAIPSPAQTSGDSTKQPARSHPAGQASPKTPEDGQVFVNVNSVETRPVIQEANKPLMTDPKPTRQPIKEKSLLILTIK